MPPSDAELIRRSREEPEAFAGVFDRHYDRIAAYVRRRLDEGAEDVTADTFVAAFQQRERFRAEHDSALPWLYGIATNMIRGRRRSERRRLRAYCQHAGRERDLDDSPDLDGRLDAAADAPRVARALERLPRRDRDALLLLAWAELSYEEIAEALQIPVGTVRSRISRARRRLRAALDATATIDDASIHRDPSEELA